MPRITPVHWKALEKVLLASGFRFARQAGSHRTYIKAGISRPVVIPTYDEVPVSIIRSNLKAAGITREEYFRLLDTICYASSLRTRHQTASPRTSWGKVMNLCNSLVEGFPNDARVSGLS